MPSSYSTDLKLELMVTGENAGTWGDKTNTNLNLVQQAIAGFESIALTDGGTVALAMTDATLSNARNMVLKFTGTLTTASTVTIPDGIEKFYIIDLSAVTGVTNLTIKTVTGTGFTAGEAAIVAAYSDGTNLNEVALNTLGGTIATAQIDDNAITTAKISDNQITTAKISDNQITTAKISDNQITTAKVSDLQITTAKIADDSVTPDKLSDTAVTPGDYTTADITVDAQGRITAAASGSAGAPVYSLKIATNGPSSGTYTANPSATKAVVAISGGGGNGFRQPSNSFPGASGGAAGGGVFTFDLNPGYTAPYSVAGNPGTSNFGGPNGVTANGGGNGGRNPSLTSPTGSISAGSDFPAGLDFTFVNGGPATPNPTISNTNVPRGNVGQIFYGTSLSDTNISYVANVALSWFSLSNHNRPGGFNLGFGGAGNAGPNTPPNPGTPGMLLVFEDVSNY